MMNNYCIENVKESFDLDPTLTHLAQSVLTSHPKWIKEKIDELRDSFDSNPTIIYNKKDKYIQAVLKNAGEYLGADPDNIALTESTTMGLSIILHGLTFQSGDHVITTTHDHYSLIKTIDFICDKNQLGLSRVSLYDENVQIDESVILGRIKTEINQKTRLLALTWVHSNTGVKLPLKKIYNLVQSENQKRMEHEKILVLVDGVHGFGIEPLNPIKDLGCDFFAAGTHKCFFGPRGTGIVWANSEAWKRLTPVIVSFDVEAFRPWRKKEHKNDHIPPARLCSPGGFSSFEHRWALTEAFKFHSQITTEAINKHVTMLASFCKKELQSIPGIKLYTPVNRDHSASMVCFDVEGYEAREVVDFLFTKKIVCNQTPYQKSCVRITPSIYNNIGDIKKAVDAIKSLAI